MHLLLVDDDVKLRTLLRTTFEGFDVSVAEAGGADEAEWRISERRPDVIVLDVIMPEVDGLELCRRLKADPATHDVPIILLTGSGNGVRAASDSAGADAFVAKPFSPLELLDIAERLAGGLGPVRSGPAARRDPSEQLLIYARDLRQLLERERRQRALLQKAYRETVSALATALETKDTGTGAHSQRVQRYALVLAEAIQPELAEDMSVEYGFLLHDVGKIGIPDDILLKPGPLTELERGVMQTHAPLGEQMLAGVGFLRGEGLKVVRSHHERWDGTGYPDGVGGEEIPLGARVFALADTLDAITSDRPYRSAQTWETARAEILAQRGSQFDPDAVDAFLDCEEDLRAVRREFAVAA